MSPLDLRPFLDDALVDTRLSALAEVLAADVAGSQGEPSQSRYGRLLRYRFFEVLSDAVADADVPSADEVAVWTVRPTWKRECCGEHLSAIVVGYCPMGCGRTLFLGDGGHVTCSFIECPSPCAVDEILDDSETEHIVSLSRAEHFTVTHPLKERLGDMAKCELHQWIAGLAGPPRAPGRYRAWRASDGHWSFECLKQAA